MSEDRHHFSEPRPIPGLDLPTWDVDVFRDGVEEPILTLRIDSKVLPPRRGKKKKIVWQLPTTIDDIPRFGIDEKRRLLDIFKNLKKERRKSKRGVGGGGSGGDGTTNEEANDNSSGDEEKSSPPSGEKNASKPTNGTTTLRSNGAPNGNGSSAVGVENLSLAPPPKNDQLPPVRLPSHPVGPPPGISATSATRYLAPPGIPPPAATTNSIANNNSETKPPPGMVLRKAQSLPDTVLDDDGNKKLPPAPPPGLSPKQHPTQPTNITPAPGLVPQPPLPVSAQAQHFFNLLPNMPHDIFAQQVANIYISLLQHGNVDDLLLYYSLTAQKSLSLKSAKSVCTTPLEMKTQLQSLVGCAFVVQGITTQTIYLPVAFQVQQQQPTIGSGGSSSSSILMIIWSGICQVQGQQHGFCHTLILTPSLPPTTSFTTMENDAMVPRYQIQNDALVLLANE